MYNLEISAQIHLSDLLLYLSQAVGGIYWALGSYALPDGDFIKQIMWW